MKLPIVVEPRADEALDSYLEHVADANRLTTADLVRLVSSNEPRASKRHWPLAPSAPTLASMSELVSQPPARLAAMTLLGLPHHEPLNLAGYDPESRHAFNTIGRRGWLRSRGTQLCPGCLVDDGFWHLPWRIFTSTCCARHGTFLVATCPSCDRPFRDQHHSPLRVVGSRLVCGNPLGQGPTAQCEQDLTRIPTRPARPVELERQQVHDDALTGREVDVLGRPTPADTYLALVRNVAVLLLHLAESPDAVHLGPWVGRVASLAAGMRTHWRHKPPRDPELRSGVLTLAHHILTQPNCEAAAEILTDWIAMIPASVEGPLSWVSDRTTMTGPIAEVVFSALNPARRLSHLLDEGQPLITGTEAVPQLVPEYAYHRHLTHLTTSRPETARLFAALCLARSRPEADTWEAAATALGFPEGLGSRTARAGSAAMTCRPTDWLTGLAGVAADLPSVGYRAREQQVQALVSRQRWFTRWARCRPGTKAVSKSYAITWLWLNYAGGHPDTTPAVQIADAYRASFRQFERSLSDFHEAQLRRVVEQ